MAHFQDGGMCIYIYFFSPWLLFLTINNHFLPCEICIESAGSYELLLLWVFFGGGGGAVWGLFGIICLQYLDLDIYCKCCRFCM